MIEPAAEEFIERFILAKRLYQLSGIVSQQERLLSDLEILDDPEFHLQLELKLLELDDKLKKIEASKPKTIQGQYFE